MSRSKISLSIAVSILFFFSLSAVGVGLSAQEIGGLMVIPITQQDQDVKASTKQKKTNQQGSDDGYNNDDYLNLNNQGNKRAKNRAKSNEVYDYNAFNNLIISLQPHNKQVVMLSKPKNVTVTLTNAGFDQAFYLAAQGTVITFHNKSNKPSRFQAYNEDQDQSLKWKVVPSGKTERWVVNKTGGWQLFVDTLARAESRLHFVAGRQTMRSSSNKAIGFTDLPIGSYQLSGWHAVLPAEKKMIRIHSNKTATIKLRFSPDAR